MFDLLRNQRGLTFREHVPANRLSTFGVGAPVPTVISLDTLEGAVACVRELRAEGIPYRVLGNGSNIILPDEPLTIPLLQFGGTFQLQELSPHFFPAQMSLMSLSRKTAQEGLSGLEFAAGIPATLGGAVRMNAGAHGDSIATVVRRVATLSDEIRVLEREELEFSYRHSPFGEHELVLGVEFDLRPGEREEILKRRQECLDYRKRTQPLTLPSAGSVFRNPTGADAAAVYLERVALKGERRGGVAYSELHSNWLVRLDDSGRAADVAELIALGKKRVFDVFGIELIPEQILW